MDWTLDGSATTPYESRDGRRVAYAAEGEHGKEMVLLERDGSGSSVVLGDAVEGMFPGEWSPDGSRLAALRYDEAGREVHGVYSVGDRVFTPFLASDDVFSGLGIANEQWLDDGRLMLIGSGSGKVLIADADTGELRETGQSIDGDSGDVFPVAGGRELVIGSFWYDSDIWLLEYDDSE